MQNTRDEFITVCKTKKIICFGAGKFLKNVKGFLDSECCKIDLLIDNNKEKWGGYEHDIKIDSPDILKKCSGDDYLILISSKNFAEEIREQIDQQHPEKFVIFKWPLIIKEYKEFDDKLWQERIYAP